MGRQRTHRTKAEAVANRVGLTVLIATACQYGLSAIVMAGLRACGVDVEARAWGLEYGYYLVLYAVLYVTVMGIPILIGKRLLPSTERRAAPLRMTASAKLCAVSAGTACCLLCNMAASALSGLLIRAGVPMPSAPVFGNGTMLALLGDIAVYAVMAATLEELLFRGIVLSALKPFGAGMSVAVSAVLFALLHGNATQMPYALLMGIVLGVVFVKTENIRLTAAIHIAVNAIAVVNSFLMQFCTAKVAVFWQTVLVTVVLMTGVAALVWLRRHVKGYRTGDGGGVRAVLSANVLWFAAVVMTVLSIVFSW